LFFLLKMGIFRGQLDGHQIGILLPWKVTKELEAWSPSPIDAPIKGSPSPEVIRNVPAGQQGRRPWID
jgi:hypothetical protein